MHARTIPADSGIIGFLRLLLPRWKLIMGGVIGGIVLAAIYLNLATYTYAITFRVSPTPSDSGNLTGRLGGLAAVAGISLGAEKTVSPFELYIESFYSPEVAAVLSRRRDLMRVAFKEEWDDRTGVFKEPTDPVRAAAQAAKSVLGIPVYPWQPPDAARLQEFIKDEVIIVRDPKKSVSSFAIDHEDPIFASALLIGLHETVDGMIRTRALNRANEHIDYLSLKLGEVMLAEHREALAESLGEQERIRMMSSSNIAYAAEPLGSPIVSLHPTKPKPTLMLALGAIAGGFLGLMAALGLGVFRSLRASRVGSLP